MLSPGPVLLTGCGAGMVQGALESTPPATALANAHIHGKVHGGIYPIQGAYIELWQTGVGSLNTTTGSYAPSFYGTTSNPNFIASTVSAKAGDTSGMAPGYFDFGTQTLACTPGNYVYLTTTGGGTVASKTNSSVIQVALIGQCPATAKQAAYFNNVNVYLSETSTVAAAYTLGNFISIDTDPKTNLQRVNIAAPANNTSTGACTVTNGTMTCTAAGLAHAFANASNLVNFVTFDGSFPSGAARATLPGNSQALAPQAMVNTLGNILQSCVDSGPSTVASPSSTCKTLLGYAPTLSGTAPTNTLQVAVNVAGNPTYNVSTLYSLQSANSPFTPMMTAAPTAFSLAIFYPAAAIGDKTFTAPVDVALDAQDNVYVAYSQVANGAVAELSAAGTPVFSGATPLIAASLTNPATLAVDPSGYIWVTDDSATSAVNSAGNAFAFNTSITSTGTSIGKYNQLRTVPFGNASGIAFDASGNTFITRDATDKHVNDYFYASGNTAYTQAGTFTGATLLRAQVDAYGTFKAVGDSTFLTYAPLPCNAGSYVDSWTTLDTTGGLALAVDNRANNYTAFLPLSKELSTASVTSNGTRRCWTATTTNNNSAGSMTNQSIPGAAALDGAGNLFWAGTKGRLYSYLGAESQETTSGGTLGGTATFFYPCLLGSATSCTYATALAGMAVDSSGALWYSAPNVGGSAYLVQHFGLAAPTWPLLAYAQSGVSF